MPRIARVVVPGIPHHITQRGNYGQVVFREDEDDEAHLYAGMRYVERNSVRAGLVKRARRLLIGGNIFLSRKIR